MTIVIIIIIIITITIVIIIIIITWIPHLHNYNKPSQHFFGISLMEKAKKVLARFIVIMEVRWDTEELWLGLAFSIKETPKKCTKKW